MLQSICGCGPFKGFKPITIIFVWLVLSTGCVQENPKDIALVPVREESRQTAPEQPTSSEDTRRSRFTSGHRAAFRAALDRGKLELADWIYASLDAQAYQDLNMARLVDHYAAARLARFDIKAASVTEILNFLADTQQRFARVGHEFEVDGYAVSFFDSYQALALQLVAMQMVDATTAALTLGTEAPVDAAIVNQVRRCEALLRRGLPKTESAYVDFLEIKSSFLRTGSSDQ